LNNSSALGIFALIKVKCLTSVPLPSPRDIILPALSVKKLNRGLVERFASGGPGFESWLWDQLSRFRYVVVFLSYSRKFGRVSWNRTWSLISTAKSTKHSRAWKD